jgi:hypothetical protein
VGYKRDYAGLCGNFVFGRVKLLLLTRRSQSALLTNIQRTVSDDHLCWYASISELHLTALIPSCPGCFGQLMNYAALNGRRTRFSPVRYSR